MSEPESKELAKVVGRAIAKQRSRCGLSQEKVAEQLGVGLEAVSRIERGVVMPTVSRLLEFATIFDCDAVDLLNESSNRPTDQANHIGSLLAELTLDDRQLVIELLERLVERLKQH